MTDASVRSPPNRGVNPPGKIFLERETAGIEENSGKGLLARHGVVDRHLGAVRRAIEDPILSVEHIADEQGLAGIGTENRGPGIGITEEEPAGYPLARVIRMTVDLHRVEDASEVAPKLEVVVDFGRAPDLRRIRDMGIATRDESRGVGALDTAAGIARVAVLDTQVGEAVLP